MINIGERRDRRPRRHDLDEFGFVHGDHALKWRADRIVYSQTMLASLSDSSLCHFPGAFELRSFVQPLQVAVSAYPA